MKYTTEFDKLFQKYAPPFIDWLWIKAQAIAESALNPNARSTVNGQPGAIGLMQIMPATGKELGFTEEQLFDPEINIMAGCEYMRRMRIEWKIIDDLNERLKFAFASYNAGLGNIRNAYKNAIKNKFEANDWSVVGGLCLRKFTGEKNTEQTVSYVARIFRIHRELQEVK